MSLTLKTIESVPSVCRLLRTKSAFMSHGTENQPPWQFGASTTAAYWCLATMQSSGPDEQYAHPHLCCKGRSCYQSID